MKCRSLNGGRQLRIKTECHGDGHIQVSVQDRGKGIGGNDLEKIFEPFYHDETGRTRHGAGHQPVDRSGTRGTPLGVGE